MNPSLLECAIAATALKLLLVPAYKSTDFEVHRNWLAITHSLPVKDWYFEITSEWTLDYPPFFAAFEWVLSQVAKLFDPEMLRVENLGYSSLPTIYFQRLSVIFTEFLLVYALHRYAHFLAEGTSRNGLTHIRFIKTAPEEAKRPTQIAALSILFSPGLLIIDHIHFQYNGFLYGILLLSLVLAKDKLLLSGTFFAALLCFKHIYLYLAPAYFVYLLCAYCLGPRGIFDINIWNTIKLGTGVLTIFGAAFGPFIYMKQIPQLFSRLFPFSRGLCHAYWAPNVWAIYSFTDRVLIYVAPRLGLRVDQSALHSATRGLVGDTSFAVLPEITPRTTFMLTLFFQLLPLMELFVRPSFENFLGSVILCGYSAFLFGWHVHEKAILLVLIPFSLVALKDRRYLAAFRPLAISGHVSLFPLLFTPHEFPIKTVYTVTWLITFLVAFDKLTPASEVKREFVLDRVGAVYIVVSVPLIIYCSFIHGLVWGGRYEFLPLMFMSSYSALGVVGSWVGFGYLYFFGNRGMPTEKGEGKI